MTAHLRILRPNVGHSRASRATGATSSIDMGSRDVLFLIDIRRYQDDLVALRREAASAASPRSLLTDQWLSPVARNASHVLPARVRCRRHGTPALRSWLIEALIAAVTQRNWPTVSARIGALEALRPDETGLSGIFTDLCAPVLAANVIIRTIRAKRSVREDDRANPCD